ncbi:MAG: Clp protease N-terminal domain-containing protein [Acidobacteriaceae bacterium]
MISEVLYRILLKAYPARYRHNYEEAMVQCFCDQLRAADTSGKQFRLWFRTMIDFVLNVPARYLEIQLRTAPGFYSERARRAIWMAGLEAGSSLQGNVEIPLLGGEEIGLEHLLLGTLRNDQELANVLLGAHGTETIARSIHAQRAHPRRSLRPHYRDRPPLSEGCKKALAKAAQEAQDSNTRVSSRQILLGILHQDSSLAARLIRENALDLSCLRSSSDPPAAGPEV